MEKESKTKKQEPNKYTFVSLLLTIVLAVVCWLNIGPVLSITFLALPILENGIFYMLKEVITQYIPFILLFGAIIFASNLIMKTPIRKLTTYENKFRYSLMFSIIGVFFLFNIILSLIHFKNISFVTNAWKERLLLLPFLIVLIPVQSVAEELLFRVMPARLYSRDTLNINQNQKILLSLVSGFIFLVPHLTNVEFSLNASFLVVAIYYFAYGALLMALGLYTNGFEASIGLHIANNMFLALFVNYPDSSLVSSPLFRYSENATNAELLINLLLVFVLIFYFLRQCKIRRIFNLSMESENGEEKESN